MNKELLTTLKNGGIAVLATDTLYGIVTNALHKESVERIYEIKGRDENKPFIILIPSIETLSDFGIVLQDDEKTFLETYWPGAVTVILPVSETYREQLSYLHRGTNDLAFRLPAKESLRQLLTETGPLVAPSANTQGMPPAYTIAEARNYFGDNVDHYEDEGRVEGLPSTIVRIADRKIEIVRQGSVVIS